MRPKSKESADQAVGYLRVLLAVGVDSAEWEAGRLVTIYQKDYSVRKECYGQESTTVGGFEADEWARVV